MSEDERARMIVRRAASVVARHAGVPPVAVLEGRGWSLKRLRHEAIYLAVTAGGVSGNRAAQAAGVARYAVQRALRQVEDSRDLGEVERRLAKFEGEMAA